MSKGAFGRRHRERKKDDAEADLGPFFAKMEKDVAEKWAGMTEDQRRAARRYVVVRMLGKARET